MLFLLSGDFFKINIFEKFFQEYHECQTVITYYLAWSGFNLFAKIISRQRLNIYAASTIFINRGLSILLLEYSNNAHLR